MFFHASCNRTLSQVFLQSLLRYLLNWALGLKEDAPAKEFGENAAHGPNINWTSIMPAAHQDFRGPVILSNHLLSHVLGLIWLLYPGQTKIADLKGRLKDVVNLRKLLER